MAVPIEESVYNALRGHLSPNAKLPAPLIIKIYVASTKNGEFKRFFMNLFTLRARACARAPAWLCMYASAMNFRYIQFGCLHSFAMWLVVLGKCSATIEYATNEYQATNGNRRMNIEQRKNDSNNNNFQFVPIWFALLRKIIVGQASIWLLNR